MISVKRRVLIVFSFIYRLFFLGTFPLSLFLPLQHLTVMETQPTLSPRMLRLYVLARLAPLQLKV